MFHLGETHGNYFYAMEFVEGETLEKLIKRSGRLEVKLALEIASQVAGGRSSRTEPYSPWIEQGIRDSRATGTVLSLPYYLGLKAEALHLADRTSEALEAINEAENVVERSEEREWCAELHRIRGVLLAAMGGDGAQIEASFCAAIRIAREQKSVSLEKRAEGTYAEYRRQKASGPVGHGFRLPL